MSTTPLTDRLSRAQALAALDHDRLARYRQYLDFYQGNQWDRPPRPGETRLTVNYARALVRKLASFVFSQPVTFSVPASPAAERYLNQLAQEQDWHALDEQTLIDAAVLGDGAFKVTWDAQAGQPRVSAIDPATLFAWVAPDNVRQLTRVAQRYWLPAASAAQAFAVPLPALDAAATVPVVEDWTADWLVIEVAGQVVRDEPNPYGAIPYVIFPNAPRPHSLWGESDLADILDLCRELNRRLTTLARILQVSGNPIVVLENVTAADGVRAEPGAVWELPPDSRAYLLDLLAGGGVRLHIDTIELLYRAIHDLAEVPRAAFGDPRRELSGAALEVELQPLVQRVQRKRRIWESIYRRRNALVLALAEQFGGYDFGGARQSVVNWGPILPQDFTRLVEAEVALVRAGIRSRQGALAALGVTDPAAEWQRALAEHQALTAQEQNGG
jgi:hypothetical protein